MQTCLVWNHRVLFLLCTKSDFYLDPSNRSNAPGQQRKWPPRLPSCCFGWVKFVRRRIPQKTSGRWTLWGVSVTERTHLVPPSSVVMDYKIPVLCHFSVSAFLFFSWYLSEIIQLFRLNTDSGSSVRGIILCKSVEQCIPCKWEIGSRLLNKSRNVFLNKSGRCAYRRGWGNSSCSCLLHPCLGFQLQMRPI